MTDQPSPEQGPDHGPNRRDFLAFAAGASATAALASSSAYASQEGEPDVSDEQLTLTDIAAVEKVMGVRFTDDQRAHVLEDYPGTKRSVEAVRTLDLDNGLSPASSFDPRLPGRTYAEANRAPDLRLIHQGSSALPTSADDIAFARLADLRRWLDSGAISAAELTELYLARIKRFAGRLNCFVTVTEALARQQAADADAALARGERKPLLGIPYALKDLADTAGIRTTWGAEPFQDRVPDSDATLVTMLREAGAILLGKATTGALAFADIWFGGMTRSPWNLDEGSSGSSAGPSSATAAGLCAFAIGTETLGSIISPATRCGLAGLRPSFGRVPRGGFMALAWSLDKVGPLCRYVEDTAMVMHVITGFDPRDAGSANTGFGYQGSAELDGLRVGYMPAAFDEDGVRDIDRDVLRAAKARFGPLTEITLPAMPVDALRPIIRAEAAAAFDRLVRSGEIDVLKFKGPLARGRASRAVRMLSAVDYINMERVRRQVMHQMADIFDRVDVIVAPNFAQSMLTITNYTGTPQLAFRSGFFDTPTRTIFGTVPNPDGPTFSVPHTTSVFGPLYGEAAMIAVAAQLEADMGVTHRRPSLG